jgi:head-tail adaptor
MTPLNRTGAGRLDQRIAFDQRVEFDDGSGNTVGDWETQFAVAGEIVWQRGGEAVMAARLAERQPLTIRVRKSSDTIRIAPAWRARNIRSGEEFQIRTVTPDNSRAMIELLCEAGVAT